MRRILCFLLSFCLILCVPVFADTKSHGVVEKVLSEHTTEYLNGIGVDDFGLEKSKQPGTKVPTINYFAGITASDNERIIFDYAGLKVELLRYEIFKSPNSTPTMSIYARVINDSDQRLSLMFKDTTIDGVPVVATGFLLIDAHSDSGEDSDISCMIIPKTDNKEDGTEAILNATEIHTTMSLLASGDDEDSDEICLKEATINLAGLDEDRNVSINDPQNDPEPEPAPDIEQPNMERANYRTLALGDKGEDVRRLQWSLIELGYLSDSADGHFGPKTATAVREFNDANGLPAEPVADYETQDLIYSGLANPYREADVPLIIGGEFAWDPIPSVNTFFFRVQVTNTSKTRAIRGYELSVYYTNVWGEKLDGGVTYTQTMTQRVQPGETVYSPNFNLGNWYSVDTVWVGVSRIVFDDGEIQECPNITYYSCTLPDVTRRY